MAISPYSTPAQQGESYGQLRFDSKAAEDYLSGAEQANYVAATRGLGLEPKRGRGGKIKSLRKTQAAHDQAADKIRRLRDVASARAFDQYTASLGDYAKPWKVQAGPQGLITASDIRDTMASDSTRSFGSMDILAGKKVRETLNSMTQSGGGIPHVLDPTLMGSVDAQKIQRANIGPGALNPNARNYGRPGGKYGAGALTNAQKRQMKIGTRTQANVADPERVYTGMGGYNWSGRLPDFGHGF